MNPSQDFRSLLSNFTKLELVDEVSTASGTLDTSGANSLREDVVDRVESSYLKGLQTSLQYNGSEMTPETAETSAEQSLQNRVDKMVKFYYRLGIGEGKSRHRIVNMIRGRMKSNDGGTTEPSEETKLWYAFKKMRKQVLTATDLAEANPAISSYPKLEKSYLEDWAKQWIESINRPVPRRDTIDRVVVDQTSANEGAPGGEKAASTK
jgi:hypothetical protein